MAAAQQRLRETRPVFRRLQTLDIAVKRMETLAVCSKFQQKSPLALPS